MDTKNKALTRAEASSPAFMRLRTNTNYGKKDDAFFLEGSLPGDVFVLQRLDYIGGEFVRKGKTIKTNSLSPFQKGSDERDNDMETGRRNTKNEHYAK